jgi:hypothetical protein
LRGPVHWVRSGGNCDAIYLRVKRSGGHGGFVFNWQADGPCAAQLCIALLAAQFEIIKPNAACTVGHCRLARRQKSHTKPQDHKIFHRKYVLTLNSIACVDHVAASGDKTSKAARFLPHGQGITTI